MKPIALKRGDALVVVDVQNDFLPGGALAVPAGDEVVPVLNRYIRSFHRQGLPIFASRDWHPPDQCSFRSHGGIWPVHCVADSPGAAFSAALRLPPSAHVISKGTASDREAYSGFQGTALAQQLRAANIKRLFVGGLATDYCVMNTVLDARRNGFEVFYLADASRAVNVRPNDRQAAESEMERQGARTISIEQVGITTIESSPLLSDLYQLTMLQGYFLNRMEGTAVFEFFVRRLPAQRNFLLAAGLEQVLEFLEDMRFSGAELEWLESTGRFRPDFLDYLRQLRFTGDVDAMPEGTVFFAEEPIIRVTAPLPQAQLVETRLINLLHFQTLIASKAARCVLVAPGKTLVDFGLRRAHGGEAGCLASRASYLAGFAATSNVLAAKLFNVPLSGTMAHSFVQAHADEVEAFERFAHANPGNVVLLLDTYDTLESARKVVEVAPLWKQQGVTVHAVRLDSGDLAQHASRVRQVLDAGELADVRILASGNIDEYTLQELASACIDGFGIGTRLDTSADVPYLDCAYKLQEYAGRFSRKRSEGKATWPGRKQVFRVAGRDGRIARDTIALEDDSVSGDALIKPFMRDGKRIAPPESLQEIRARVANELARLPNRLRQLTPASYPVDIAPSIRALAESLDAETEPVGA